MAATSRSVENECCTWGRRPFEERQASGERRARKPLYTRKLTATPVFRELSVQVSLKCPGKAVCSICVARVVGWGLNSSYLPFEPEAFLPVSNRRRNTPIDSSAYKSCPGLTTLIGGSASHSGCPSLNKRSLPRLSSPGQALRQRVDLIVVPARK
jgi:hypothetical protein